MKSELMTVVWDAKDLGEQKVARYVLVSPVGSFFVESYAVGGDTNALYGRTVDGDDIVVPNVNAYVIPSVLLNTMVARDAIELKARSQREVRELHKTLHAEDPEGGAQGAVPAEFVGHALSGGIAL
jgi:hypothetical protein